MYRIRLVKKLAPVLNGIDLAKLQVGQCFDLPDEMALMLLREGWAELAGASASAPGVPTGDADTDDGS